MAVENDQVAGNRRGRRPFHAWRERAKGNLGEEPGDHWFFGGRRFAAWRAAHGTGDMNPLVALFLSRGGGILPLLVLHFLAQEPRYGNDIMRELEQRTSGAWISNPGAIYPLLRRMEHRGLATGEWEDASKRTRRVYQLTDMGHQEYERILELMKPLFGEALVVIQSVYDTLYYERKDQGNSQPPA